MSRARRTPAAKSPAKPVRMKKKEAGDRKCTLCGREMFFAEDFQVHVCINDEHGVLAYYGVDDCYFTSREAVGAKFLKEGRKFHLIEAGLLEKMGVSP